MSGAGTRSRIAASGVLGVVLSAGLLGGAFGMRFWMTRNSADGGRGSSNESAVENAHGDGHAGSEGEGAHEGPEDSMISISPEMMKQCGIEVAEAGPGTIERTMQLPGEVRLNADRVAHIVPRVSGMVREVHKNLGDAVIPGEVMAILDSRELADAKAADLAAASRLELARKNLERVEKLFEKKIAPEEELLKARQSMAEIEIDHRTAEAKLHALGLSPRQIEGLHAGQDADYSCYEIRAPFAGTVVEKHCALGEVLTGESDAFVLADLSTVWATITVYAQDLGRVQTGQSVQIRAEGLGTTASGLIAYLAPVANETTRTVYARVDLPNSERQWRPGTFVTATITLERQPAAVVVPIDAVQRVRNDTVVFVAAGEGFEPRVVTVGRMDAARAEITGNLKPGERYVSRGAAVLKAELGKREAVHEH